MMDRIIRSTEQHKMYRSIVEATQPGEEQTSPHAVATAAADLASVIHAAAIVAYTSSGTTARACARASGRACRSSRSRRAARCPPPVSAVGRA